MLVFPFCTTTFAGSLTAWIPFYMAIIRPVRHSALLPTRNWQRRMVYANYRGEPAICHS